VDLSDACRSPYDNIGAFKIALEQDDDAGQEMKEYVDYIRGISLF
jgi:hypothetical protein